MAKVKDKIPGTYAVGDIENKSFKTIQIEDPEFKAHIGEPQLGNSDWLIFGGPGEGKTSYVLQAVKKICIKHKVLYDTLEEGMKKSFQLALKRNNMKSANGFNFQSEKLPELTLRLSKKRQAKIVVIDSVQYFFRGMTTKDYFDFRKQYIDTTFIWISGADGKTPIGKIAQDIRFEADIVLFVKDYEAIVLKNRFEAYDSYIIWHEGYNTRKMNLLQKG